MVDYDLPLGRRKLMALGTSVGAGSIAAGGVTVLHTDEEVYQNEDKICYLTENKELEGENVSLFFQHSERENEFRQVNTALEPTEEGKLEACVSIDEFNLEVYDSLSHVEINGEKVWEGDYSVS